MDNKDREAILKTRAAKGREPLAQFLVKQPQISYNDCLTALKAAGRPKPKNLFERGRAAAMALLGKED